MKSEMKKIGNPENPQKNNDQIFLFFKMSRRAVSSRSGKALETKSPTRVRPIRGSETSSTSSERSKKRVLIIFPIQLFQEILETNYDEYIIVEDEFYFNPNYCKLKLAYMRACMKQFEKSLLENGKRVTYIDLVNHKSIKEITKDTSRIYEAYTIEGIYMTDVSIIQSGIHFLRSSPAFVFSHSDLKEYEEKQERKNAYFSGFKEEYKKKSGNEYVSKKGKSKKGQKKEYYSNFYKWARRTKNVMMDGRNYMGLFDKKEDLVIPNDAEIPVTDFLTADTQDIRKEAIQYVKDNFKNSPGDNLNYLLKSYPISFQEADHLLSNFINKKLIHYRDYYKYMVQFDDKDDSTVFMYSSVLSIPLNMGIISPWYLIKQVEEANVEIKGKRGQPAQISVVNKEAFINDILGKREYQRYLYYKYFNELEKSNYIGATNKIEKGYGWFPGDPMFTIPVMDDIITAILSRGFVTEGVKVHYLINFMTLLQINPISVVSWMNTFLLDMHQWNTLPFVVLNMYASKTLSSEPGVTSSNFIINHSDYQNSNTELEVDKEIVSWGRLWDGLYYSYFDTNNELFYDNPDVAFGMKLLQKRSDEALEMDIACFNVAIKEFTAE